MMGFVVVSLTQVEVKWCINKLAVSFELGRCTVTIKGDISN